MQPLTQEQQVAEVELSLAAAKSHIARATAVKRLYKNKDFKKVFLDFFLGEDVSRVVKAMSEPALQSEADQLALTKRLTAVGQVDQFMRMTERLGDMAQDAIGDHEAAIVEILSEDQE